MRSDRTVWMLALRYPLFPALAAMAAGLAAQAALFLLALGRGPVEGAFSLEGLIVRSGLLPACGVSFLLLSLALILRNRELSGSYAARRLSVKPETVYLLEGAAGTLYFLLFWALETLLMLLLARVYAAQAPAEYVTGQTVFLAFVRSGFLQGLLPMGDLLGWFTLAVLILGLGFAAARRPRETVGLFHLPYLLPVAAALFFPREMATNNSMLPWLILASAVLGGWGLVKGALPDDNAGTPEEGGDGHETV